MRVLHRPGQEEITVRISYIERDDSMDEVLVHGRLRQVSVLLGMLLAGFALPARAVDVVPFAGFRFGGDVTTQPPGTSTESNSLSLNAALSYGAVVDIPLYDIHSLEIYYSRQPTTISPGANLTGDRDVTVTVLHVGLVDAVPSDEHPQLSWLLFGTFGGTQLSAGGETETKPSIGLGGGVVWMASKHIGIRGDIRALITFTGNSNTAAICNGGCNVAFTSSAIAQGEMSVGLVARF
jgi:hypothetical protein